MVNYKAVLENHSAFLKVYECFIPYGKLSKEKGFLNYMFTCIFRSDHSNSWSLFWFLMFPSLVFNQSRKIPDKSIFHYFVLSMLSLFG